MQKTLKYLEDGKSAREVLKENIEYDRLKKLQLITAKPVLYVCNVEETCADKGNDLSKNVQEYVKNKHAESLVISAKIESEIATLESNEDKNSFLESLGLQETGLSRVIKAGHDILGLQTYFTVGPKEAHAWTIQKNTSAPKSAGVIHTDFEKGFIRAEVIGYQDYVDCNGEAGAKEKGKMRLEGKDYIVQDGDVVHFRFNV
jgi:GTP-binding protein YchF